MGTEIKPVKPTLFLFKQFFGGDLRGVCIQITEPTPEPDQVGYIQLTGPDARIVGLTLLKWAGEHDPADKLRLVAELTLLFHSSSPWDEAKKERWTNLMTIVDPHGASIKGNAICEATTKNLCDAIRSALSISN